MQAFEPLHIRAYLQTPVISDQYLPLDGVLYYHWVRFHFGAQDITKPRESTVREKVLPPLPIQRIDTDTDHWFYACSFARFPEHARRGNHEYAKRFRSRQAEFYVDFQDKRGRVNTQRGPEKNYWNQDYTFSSPYVDWYCVGDKARIENLLQFVTNIGKKASQGGGSVLRWEVNPTTRNWALHDDMGRIMRALPNPDSGFLYGIRPSYWLPHHQFRVDLP